MRWNGKDPDTDDTGARRRKRATDEIASAPAADVAAAIELVAKKGNTKVLVYVVAAILASGGASFIALPRLAEDNRRAIQETVKDLKAHSEKPSHNGSEEKIELIKVRIGKMETEQQLQGRDIDYIKEGIDDIKRRQRRRSR